MGVLSVITDFFTKSGATLVDSIGNAIDSCVTSDDERLTLKNQLASIENNWKRTELEYWNKQADEITKRWTADANGGFLQRNVRPLSLLFMLGIVSFLSIGSILCTELKPNQLAALNSFLPMFTSLLTIAVTAYFGCRTVEKGLNVYQQNKTTRREIENQKSDK